MTKKFLNIKENNVIFCLKIKLQMKRIENYLTKVKGEKL